ncbi:unnamed protein product [Symbiodinium natans]|uniref:Uncharacterized protein n=1 Tax=Symbiodinium natans TaxID=878477 RepID=A0A812JC46_9DINO|nr:unnamed protein product [Symbiodinium natans]
MDSPRTTAMGEHDEGIDPIDLALDYMGKAIIWVAAQLTPQQVQEIAERINSPTTTADEISQWFQATLNVMRPLSPHREEQMEDGETLDLDKPDWGVTSESEAEATKTKDRGARPCEKPSASSPTRDIDEDAHKEKVRHDDRENLNEERKGHEGLGGNDVAGRTNPSMRERETYKDKLQDDKNTQEPMKKQPTHQWTKNMKKYKWTREMMDP